MTFPEIVKMAFYLSVIMLSVVLTLSTLGAIHG
jgi:hypothetical protein